MVNKIPSTQSVVVPVELVNKLVQELAPDQGQSASIAFGLALELQGEIAVPPSISTLRADLNNYVTRCIRSTPEADMSLEEALISRAARALSAPAPSSLAGGEVDIEAIARAIDPDAWAHVDACHEAMKTCGEDKLSDFRKVIERRLHNSESIQAAERVIAILAALSPEAPAREGADWQPIETAPQDGTKIDLWGHWSEGDEWKRAPGAAWSSEHGEWQLGQYRVSQYLYPVRITHWRAITGPNAPTPRHEAPASDMTDVEAIAIEIADTVASPGLNWSVDDHCRSELHAHTVSSVVSILEGRHEAPAEGAGEAAIAKLFDAVEMADDYNRLSDRPKRLAKDFLLDSELRDAVSSLRARSSAPEAREEALGNLLAVIHGDGGHRALEVGTKQAAIEAEKIVAGLFAAPSADKLRASTGTHWWNPDNDEEGFSCWGDAFEDATFNGWDAPVRLERAKRLPDVWAARIDIDTTGDGEADDYEIRLFDTEAEALAALKAEGC